MKRSILLALTILSVGAIAQTTKAPAPAKSVLAEASRAAKSEKKNVLVIFHASWCGWCHRLEGVLASKEIKPIMDKHFKTVWLDVGEQPEKKALENPGGEDTLAALGGKDFGGYPYYAIVDASGKMLIDSKRAVEGKPSENIGYPGQPEEIAWFMKMLKASAPKMSGAEAKTIEDYLVAHKP